MTTTPEQFEYWLGLPSETSTIEFKEAKEQYDLTKLYRYCVAIANEKGGKLILGVTNAKPRAIVGTKAFLNVQEIESKILSKLHFRVDVEEFGMLGKRCLIFHIPPRPQGTAYNLEGAYWMRSTEDTVAMSEDRLRQIFDEGKVEWLGQVAKRNIHHDEIFTLLDTNAYAEMIGLPIPASPPMILERLQIDRILFFDHEELCVTNLGAISFARRLNDFGNLAMKSVRVIAHPRKDKTNVHYDETFNKGYAVGFDSLIELLSTFVPTNESFTKALRQEHRMFPLPAVRELVANALVHQDFQLSGSNVKIEIYSNRIEIRNPGTPPISIERFIDEDLARNDRLSELFRRLKICERRGSGIDNVIKIVEDSELPPPEFRQSDIHTTAILYAHKELSEMDREARVRACYQHACLRYTIRERLTNASLRERFKLPEQKTETVSRIIREAVAAGKIKLADPDISSNRYRSYIPFWA